MMTKFIILLLSIVLGLCCGFNLYNIITDIFTGFSTEYIYFFCGVVFSLLVVSIYKRKLEFFSTFEHELTHNIWALIFFRKPMGFHVNSDGSGLFQFIPGGKFSDIFISLSPYFFPTSCFIWLPFHIICKEEYMWFYFLMMGIFFGYQIISTIHETGSYQTDISSHGVVYSYFVFIPLYIVFHGIILAHLTNGFSGIGDFLIFDAYENGQMFFQTIKMQLGS